MKRKFAALGAALLLLSGCAANSASVQQLPEKPVSTMEADAPVGQADTQKSDAVTLPSIVEDQKPVVTEESVPTDFLDEPYEYQADVEEIVSISLTLPKITLDSAEASGKINAVFEKLQTNLYDFASTTVYETAQENNALGFLEGSYATSLKDGILSVSYTLEERYSSGDTAVVHENIYRFDALTGEQLDA